MKNQNSSDIISTVETGILKIVLNRPEKKNAINWRMYAELSKILRDSIQNSNIYMVVFTGNGSFFSSGNDLTAVMTGNDEGPNVKDAVQAFKEFVDSLIVYPKLLIAIVNGPAIGIAVTMLPLFDMVYASDKAFFQTPFTNLGLVAEGCSTYTFPRIMGNSKAGDMLYLCYKMNALEAKQVGLISDVYEDDRLEEVWTYLKKVSTLSLEAILAIKRLVKKWNAETLLEINNEEATILLERLDSPDLIERFLNFISRKSKM